MNIHPVAIAGAVIPQWVADTNQFALTSICNKTKQVWHTKMIAEATWFDLELTPSSCYKEGLKIPLTLYIYTLSLSSPSSSSLQLHKQSTCLP